MYYSEHQEEQIFVRFDCISKIFAIFLFPLATVLNFNLFVILNFKKFQAVTLWALSQYLQKRFLEGIIPVGVEF